MARLSPKTTKRLLIGALLAAAIAVGLVNTHHKEVSELDVYTRGASRMAIGEEIYRPDEPKPFTYPPAFALPFVGFRWIPQGAHRTVWFFVNLATFLGIFLLLRRAMLEFLASREGEIPRGVWIWLVVFLLGGRHISAVFENQSHDLLVCLVVTIGAWFSARARDPLAGFAFGVGASFKATPFLFAPVLFWQRRYLAGLAVVAATAGMLWLPDLLFPRADGGHWVAAWYRTFVRAIEVGGTANVEGAWTSWNFLNQNLGSSLYRLLTPVATIPEKVWDVSLFDASRGTLKAVTLALQLAILVFIAWCVQPGCCRNDSAAERSFRRIGEAGLVACGMVLLSPMSSKAHFCVLFIALLFTVTHFFAVRRDAIQALLLACVFITGTLTMKGLVGTQLGNEFLARGSVCWSTVLVLLTTGRALRLGFRVEHGAGQASEHGIDR